MESTEPALPIAPIGTGRVSLPRRVANALRDAIHDGTLSAGHRFPTEVILANQLGVSRASLREAMRVLESEGLIVRRDGVGTFVASSVSPIRSGIEQLYGITEFIRRAGHIPSVRDLQIELIGPPPGVAAALGLAPGAVVYHVSRTYTADGRPVIQCEDYVPTQFIPVEVQVLDFQGEISLYDFIRERCGLVIERAIATIIPWPADHQLARNLNVTIGEPLLLLEQAHYVSDGRVVLFSRNFHDSRAIQFQVVRKSEW